MDSFTFRQDLSQEMDWAIPGVLLTAGLAAFSLYHTPRYSGILPVLLFLPLWLFAALASGGLIAAGPILRMMRSGVEHPIGHCAQFLRRNAKPFAFIAFGMVLAGLNMIAFMWVKPLLNYLIPFRADPYLAAVDRMIFRTDPWHLLTWLNVTPLAYFYHRGWFALMIIVLLKVLMSPSSPQKSAILLTYFLLWSVFGPVMHTLLPAAGPVFYAKLGYGNAFSGLVMEPETRKLADYLWRIYSDQTFGGGAGISAMPSLHIATTGWMVIAVRQFAPRWTLPTAAAGGLIFLLSISLGWHYAIDGIIGLIGAYAIWRVTLAVLTARAMSTRTAAQSA
jgi:hypothetical protein